MKIKFLHTLKTFIAICALGVFAFSATAQTAEEFFMLGNNAYKSGEFERAKQDYLESANQGGYSAELSFNLANTYAKLGDKGNALLHYLRSIYENPRMREGTANLEMFAKDNALDLPYGVFAAHFMVELSDSEWAIAAFVSFWIAALAICVPPLFSKKNMAWIFLAIIALAITAVSAVALHGWNSYKNIAVAVDADTPLRLSPVANAPIASMVDSGKMGFVQNRSGKFVYITTSGGQQGWASQAQFVPVGNR